MSEAGTVALRHFGPDEKAWLMIVGSQVVEDPTGSLSTETAWGRLTFAFVVGVVDEEWDNFPVFGLSCEMLKGHEYGIPSNLTASLLEDGACSYQQSEETAGCFSKLTYAAPCSVVAR